MKLHNTLTNTLEPVLPLANNSVTIYTCGLTVYSQPHIGNWVAYLYWDLLVRALRASGLDVTRVQNITDVGHLTDDGDAGEDKMQKGALREGKTAWDIAEQYSAVADHEAYDLLKLIRPDHMPRATEFIQQQIKLVQELEEKGYTYQITDGVYFDTSKVADYGKLARLDIKGLRFGARVADSGKKNPTDFALWKFSPVDEKRDMEWESPWGVGFPGWHIECSAMARELLGDTITIHTGGIDHIPVHHTNEIAQTESVTGQPFANMWVHSNHLKVDGTKMSKSLGNIITLTDIIEKGYDLNAFKLLVLAKHYRTEGNFTWEILEASKQRLNRWRQIAALRHQANDTLEDDDDKDAAHDVNGVILASSHAMREALQQDLNTPEAFSHLERAFDAIESANRQTLQKSALVGLLEEINDLYGIDLLTSTPDLDDTAKRLLVERQRARDAKEWGRSDELREQLRQTGIAINDGASGQTWHYS